MSNQDQDPFGGPPPPYDPGQQQYPPPGYGQPPNSGYQQPPYYGGQPPAAYPPPPPTSIKVLGILNLVFGSFALCCGFLGGFGLFMDPAEGVNTASLPFVLSVTGSGLIAIAAGAFIAGGIGLLLNKNWGRVVSMAGAFLIILASLIEIPLASQLAMAETATMDEAAMFGDGALMMMAYLAATMCGCVQSLYPIILLIMLNMANVKDALE